MSTTVQPTYTPSQEAQELQAMIVRYCEQIDQRRDPVVSGQAGDLLSKMKTAIDGAQSPHSIGLILGMTAIELARLAMSACYPG